MTAEVTIRAHRESDFSALLDLWQAAWQVTMPAIDFAARRPGFRLHLDGLIAAGAVLRVAESAGAPAGFITVHPATGYIDQVAVAREFWGRGVAEVLIRDAQAISPTQLSLKVNQSNTRAIAFYERMGFVRSGSDVSETSGLPLWIYRWQG